MVEFHVVGRATNGETTIEKTAQTLTHYSWGEPHRFRFSPTSRVVVAKSKGTSIQAEAQSITAKAGETVTVPLRVVTEKPESKLSFSINRAITHFKCGVGPQVTVPISNGQANVSFKVPNYKPGTYQFVVADAWNSETRKGLPGPCTSLIELKVE